MIISFIGFSGTGKSYWSRKLQDELGYEHYCCDEEIARQLSDESDQSLRGTSDVANWMGSPRDPESKEKEAHYLELENISLERLCEALQQRQSQGEMVVLATTGSFVYCRPELIHQLKELSTLVHLQLSDTQVAEALKTYREDPKPIIWDGHFSLSDGETFDEALERSFFALVRARQQKYLELADVTLPYEFHKKSGLEVQSLMLEVKRLLKEAKGG